MVIENETGPWMLMADDKEFGEGVKKVDSKL